MMAGFAFRLPQNDPPKGKMTMESESLKKTEAECAAGRTSPRVSLDDLTDNIAYQAYFTGRDAIVTLEVTSKLAHQDGEWSDAVGESLNVLTICLLVTKCGFTIIGKSAPASPENFSALLGRQLAYEDAVRQLWPLMGYALREKLASA